MFAGAGSGKTRVLTRRIANLVLSGQARSSEILAVTFTNKAAGEMKSRVRSLMGDHLGSNPAAVSRMWVSTFHAMCVRILRMHAENLGFTNNFVIYDSKDSLSAMKRVFKAIGVNPKSIEPKTVLSAIDRAKNSWKDSESIRQETSQFSDMAALTADLFDAYQEELIKCNAMDFGDLLSNTLSLLELDKDICEQLQRKFKFILVDEYQDTNTVQYLLLKKLAGSRKNICAVGDDDQSIYGFRGASIEKILSFERDYPDAKILTLNTNYRSTSTILEVANQVISQNKKRHLKTMSAIKDGGDKVICFKAWNEKYEAQFVVNEILKLLDQGVDLKDIAIFYRTNAQSRAMEESLLEAALPYEIYGGHKFYDRKEIKDILAYLRLLLNPQDNESFLRIINTPARGIGASTINSLQALATKQNQPLLFATREALENPELSRVSKAGLKKLSAFISFFDSLLGDCEKARQLLSEELIEADPGEAPQASKVASKREEQFYAVCDVLKNIADKSGYIAFLKKQGSDEANSRLENIHELFSVAFDYVSRHFELSAEFPSLDGFLDRASLSSDLDKDESKVEGDQKSSFSPLSLMTLHLAKGLEFEYVFLSGLEEGLLPHVRSLEDKSSIEEERRLCYVGITRAKKRLYLSRASDRQTWGSAGFYSGMASRFIEEIPIEATEDRESSGFFESY